MWSDTVTAVACDNFLTIRCVCDNLKKRKLIVCADFNRLGEQKRLALDLRVGGNMNLQRCNPWSCSGVVAIDIGSSSIKLLELAAASPKWQVRSAGIHPLPLGTVTNNMVEDTAAVARAIRNLMGAYKVRGRRAFASVPGKCVMLKKMRISPHPGEALPDTVEFEAADAIPESIENVHMDFAVLEGADDAGELDVLLAAARKELIQRHTDILRAAGLAPAIVDIDYFALQRLYLHSQPRAMQDTVGLVHIGASSTIIHIIQGENSLFTSDVAMGGENFTEQLMVELGIEHAEAERVKLANSVSGKQGSHVDPVLMPLARHLASEILRAVKLWEAVATETRLDRIILSGGASRLRHLYDSCLETLRVPVLRSQPFAALSLQSNLRAERLKESEADFAVAAGLALRAANEP